jgi:hypothetical protein
LSFVIFKSLTSQPYLTAKSFASFSLCPSKPDSQFVLRVGTFFMEEKEVDIANSPWNF